MEKKKKKKKINLYPKPDGKQYKTSIIKHVKDLETAHKPGINMNGIDPWSVPTVTAERYCTVCM